MIGHTPTPWRVEPIEGSECVVIVDRDGYSIAEGLWPEDAAHIVACVNSHDALVAAYRFGLDERPH